MTPPPETPPAPDAAANSNIDTGVLGLVDFGILESLLAGLRSYQSSHTTSRIDLELGTNLFQHLFALPIEYFKSRRAGDSVARMREVDNIRNFLTSSALTLAIDLP